MTQKVALDITMFHTSSGLRGVSRSGVNLVFHFSSQLNILCTSALKSRYAKTNNVRVITIRSAARQQAKTRLFGLPDRDLHRL